MKPIKHITTGLSVLLFCACTDLQDLEINNIENLIEIDCEISQLYESRVNDKGFVEGDAIGVFIVDYENGNSGELKPTDCYANNVKFTLQGTKWDSSIPINWKDKTSHADFYSYYPYDSNLDCTSDYLFSVQRRQDTEATDTELCGYEKSDFLWAKAENQQPFTRVYLSHRHIMSSVELSLIEGDGFMPGEWAEASKAVTLTNTYVDAAINLSTGNVVCRGNPTSIVPYHKNSDWRCVVVPQTIEAGSTILQISINGVLYSFTRESNTEYPHNKLTKFAIKVNKHESGDYEFTLISEAVMAWTNDAVSHAGEARAYITVNVPKAGQLKEVISNVKLNCSEVLNLKIIGQLNDSDFNFIRENMTYLEAINLKDVILKDCQFDLSSYHEDDCIPFEAFVDMTTLKYVVFPDRLRKIGARAFSDTSLTQQLDFPEGLTHIGWAAFANRSQNSTITKVSFPSSLIEIGRSAFYNCDFDQELVFPESLTNIGGSAFLNCSNICGTLHIPAGMECIEEETFGYLTGLIGTLDIPGNITKIGDLAFEGTGASALVLNEGLKRIGNGAFYRGGTSSRPDNLPFSGDLIVPSTVIELGDYAFSETGFQHIYLPDNFEELPDGIFRGCSQLIDTIYIPSKVNHLGSHAFAKCHNLSAIVLPENLLSIGEGCFWECWTLDEIRCMSQIPPILESNDIFDGVPKDNFTLVVPKGCVDAYRNAEGWNEFKRISEYRNFVCRPQTARLLNKGHKRDVILNADDEWSVTHQPSWARISKTSGKQKTALTVTIDDLAAGAGNRTDSIVFSLSGTDHTTCYKITQYDSEYIEDSYMTLQSASRGAGIDLVFLGDGYDAADIAQGLYVKDMEQSMEYFFDVEPYKTYRDYFNVYTVLAMSYESGIETVNTKRDVKFKSFIGSRISCDFDAALYYAIDNSPVTESKIDALTCLVIPNTTCYDGVTAMYTSNSYGEGAAVALCPKSGDYYPYDARGIIQHEGGGHAFGKFADEYIYHIAWIQTCNCICCGHVEALNGMQAQGWGLNLSFEGRYSTVPWSHMVADNRYNDIVDIYEGGFFHSKGLFRSEVNSCMNNNVPYYSSWCRERIVKRIKRLAGEEFSYEDFVANDSRLWGQDFTTNSRANPMTLCPTPPNHGQSPIIMNRRPSRRK